jgi:hypothetical protein
MLKPSHASSKRGQSPADPLNETLTTYGRPCLSPMSEHTRAHVLCAGYRAPRTSCCARQRLARSRSGARVPRCMVVERASERAKRRCLRARAMSEGFRKCGLLLAGRRGKRRAKDGEFKRSSARQSHGNLGISSAMPGGTTEAERGHRSRLLTMQGAGRTRASSTRLRGSLCWARPRATRG